MMPREIHDPKVLEIIAKEAEWVAKRCYAGYSGTAYRVFAQAARSLAWVIEYGRPPRGTCAICKKNLRLKSDGTFRYHSGCRGDGMTPEETVNLSATPH